jgi:hypothetical protein
MDGGVGMSEKLSVTKAISNSRLTLRRLPLVSFSVALIIVSVALGGLASVLPDRVATVGQTSISDQICIPWQGKNQPNMSKVEILNAADSGSGNLQVLAGDRDEELSPNERISILTNSSSYLRVQSAGLSSANAVGTLLSRFDSSEARGLAHADCQPLVTERWFPAVTTISGYAQELILANPDAQPVIVQLSAFTDSGEFVVTEFARISVPANSVESVDLTRVVPGGDAVTLKILAEEGRVATHIQVRRIGVNQSLGVAVNGGVSSPSNRVVIHGVTNGSDSDLLAVTALADDAVVTATLYNETGSQTLAEFDDLLVPAKTVKLADIAGAIGNSPATIVLTADQPIVAGITQQVGRLNFSDIEILVGQPLVTSRSTAVLPTAFSNVQVMAFANTEGEVIVNVRKESELIFSETYNLKEKSFSTLTFRKRIPQGASLHFDSKAEIALTVWVDREIKNSVVTTAMQLKDLQAEVVPGARLELLQP